MRNFRRSLLGSNSGFAEIVEIDLQNCLPYGNCQRLGEGRQVVAAADADEQFVIKLIAQPPQDAAHRRLGDMHLFRRARDVLLRQQGVERGQQVEIEIFYIFHRLNRRTQVSEKADSSGWKMPSVNAGASCKRRCRQKESASNKRKEEDMPVTAKTVPFASKPQRPEFSVLLNRVRELQPAVRAAARDTETNRRVSKKTMDLLREAEKLTKLVRPARFGGFEYGTNELAQIAFELGRACSSAGW